MSEGDGMSDETPFEDSVLEDFEKYYGTGEVARMFGVHVGTLTRWRKEGRIEAIRTPGGRWRYSHTEVQQLWKKMHDESFALPAVWRSKQ